MIVAETVFSLLIAYYFSVNLVSVVLMIVAIFAIRKDTQSRPLIESLRQKFHSFAPSISILAPAYNEEMSIVESVKSFLMLDYPQYEVIVINDGSKDGTLAKLIQAFELKPALIPYDPSLSTTKVRGVYRSRIHENLVVVDKENGGKADALNVGLGHSEFGIFCAVDADSVLEEDALKKVVIPFVERPELTIASGGTVRIANGIKVKYGRVNEVHLSRNYLVLMQIIEYTRAFLCGRIGWNFFNSTLVISGAFGLFSKKAVMAVGGYRAGCIGEDMELVVRMHRHYREEKKPYSIVFIPDPVCWTEAPEDFSTLQKQRDRWQRGLADSLSRHRKMFMNPTYGFLGLFTFPYFLFVELFGPVVEIFSIICVGVFFATGLVSPQMFWLFLLVGVLYGTLLSIAALVIEEVYFSKYGKVRQFFILFAVALFESFGYRQITSIWRLKGLYKYLRGDTAWGHLKRKGFTQ